MDNYNLRKASPLAKKHPIAIFANKSSTHKHRKIAAKKVAKNVDLQELWWKGGDGGNRGGGGVATVMKIYDQKDLDVSLPPPRSLL